MSSTASLLEVDHLDAYDPEVEVARLEWAYEKRLRKLVRAAVRETNKRLVNDLEDLVGLPPAEVKRRIVTRANKIAVELRKRIDAKAIKADADVVAARTEAASRRRFLHDARASGLDDDGRRAGLEVDLERQRLAFVKRQVDVVHGVIEGYRAGLVDHVAKAIRPGTKLETVVRLTRRRGEVLETRVAFHARAQTQDLLGRLDRSRARAAGIVRYRWITRGDSNVRPTHRARADRVFRYDSDGPHPGEEPGCRCRAEPVPPKSRRALE